MPPLEPADVFQDGVSVDKAQVVQLFDEQIQRIDDLENVTSTSEGSEPGLIENISLAAAVAGNELTVTWKTAGGAVPNVTDKIRVSFRKSPITDGGFVTREGTATSAIVLTAGSTLGFSASQRGVIYVGVIDNAGTMELALSGDASAFDEAGLVSTTAIGSGAADSGSVLYSTTARSNVACRLLGMIRIQTGGTAGNWTAAPTSIVMEPHAGLKAPAISKLITPRRFGVVGDGTTLDHVALQAFLDAGPGHVLELPPATYAYTGPLYVRSDTQLVGYGAILKPPASADVNTTGLHLTAADWLSLGPSNVLIQGVKLDGNRIARAAAGSLDVGGGITEDMGQAAMLYCISANHIRIRDVTVDDATGDGIYVGGTTAGGGGGQCTSVWVSDCEITRAGRNGLAIVGAVNCTVERVISDDHTHGESVGNFSHGFDIEPNDANSSNENVSVVNCSSRSCADVAFGFHADSFNFNCRFIFPAPADVPIGVGRYGTASARPSKLYGLIERAAVTTPLDDIADSM